MKFLAFKFALLLTAATAFAPSGNTLSRRQSTHLAAAQQDNKIGAAVASVALGWTLVASSAFAVDLDFSLPSYDTKMAGFGEGTEAILNGKTGSTEKTKEEIAAKKAALALRDERNKKSEMRKLQYEADKQKALEKKARDAERLKNIWN